MAFQKGRSGNPGGRSSERAFADALRAAVNAEDPATKRRKIVMIAEKVVELAVAGESWAVAQVADRLDGKPAQTMDMTIRQMAAKQLSDDELADIAVGSGEGDSQPPVDPSQLN
jgi:hypothetical protein